MSGPTDEAIEETLSKVPSAAWTSFLSAFDQLEREESHVTWAGGAQVDTRVVDGRESRVFTGSYPVYSEPTSQTVKALYDMGAVITFDWPGWDEAERYRGPVALDTSSVADAVRMTTAIVRAERFCEGTIGGMLSDGTLLAALRRIRRWHDEELPRRI